MKKRTRLITTIALTTAAILFGFLFLGILHWYPPYRGRVLEAGSERPVNGSQVIAIYRTYRMGPGGSVYYYLAHLATRTGPDGTFAFPGRIYFKLILLGGFERHPFIHIHKSGYANFPAIVADGGGERFIRWGDPDWDYGNGMIPPRKESVFLLPRLESEDDLKKWGQSPGLLQDIPGITAKQLSAEGFSLEYR